MAERIEAETIQEERYAGAILGMFGALAALELFVIVLILGKPIHYLNNLEFSLAYSFVVALPAVCVVSLAIHKTRKVHS